MNSWFHWAARVNHDASRALDLPEEARRPFSSEGTASKTWASLKRAFPQGGAAILMPDHVHLILNESDSRAAARVIAGILSTVSRTEGTHWRSLSPPAPIADGLHLRRTIRYVILNPIRSELTVDPATWRWSTYRDAFGGTANPWHGPRWLLHSLWRDPLLAHEYFCRDERVRRGAPPLAGPTQERAGCPEYSAKTVALATAVALERPVAHLRESPPMRRFFVQLAYAVGLRDRRDLARICGITPRAVHKCRYGSPVEVDRLRVGRVALADSRLREGVSPVDWA